MSEERKHISDAAWERYLEYWLVFDNQLNFGPSPQRTREQVLAQENHVKMYLDLVHRAAATDSEAKARALLTVAEPTHRFGGGRAR